MNSYDENLSFAYSLKTNKGIYALLLGSGISRSAGIPTGWEITMDLVKKIAAMSTKDDVGDLEKWYYQKYNKAPDYSEVLEQLARTPAERSQLLKQYFEPTVEEEEIKLKLPTQAHRVIADLIKEGYIKVVITTNFDKLLERALNDVGVTPNIISNKDQLKGSLPLVHSVCTIVKIHGDYSDIRIKNITSELEEYDLEMNDYLDRIFDEFGLIVCGWSGEWDIALRACFERCKSHRFSTYWLRRGDLSERVQLLVRQRHAIQVSIDNADDFFVGLKEKVVALNDIEFSGNSLSTAVACATLKKLLPESKNLVRVNDLLIDEAKNVKEFIETLEFPKDLTPEIVKMYMEKIEAKTNKLLKMVSLVCYWGNQEHHSIIIDVIQIFNQATNRTYYESFRYQSYPLLLLVYTIFISTAKSKRYSLIDKIMRIKSAETKMYAVKGI